MFDRPILAFLKLVLSFKYFYLNLLEISFWSAPETVPHFMDKSRHDQSQPDLHGLRIWDLLRLIIEPAMLHRYLRSLQTYLAVRYGKSFAPSRNSKVFHMRRNVSSRSSRQTDFINVPLREIIESNYALEVQKCLDFSDL